MVQRSGYSLTTLKLIYCSAFRKKATATEWRLLGDDGLTGMRESSRRVQWPAAKATLEHTPAI
jgi:hypothetical protein